MNRSYVVVYNAANLPQAHLLRNLLAEYQIEVRILDEVVHHLAEDPSAWRSTPRVAVPSEDAEFAREVAEDFDAQVRRGAAAAQLDDDRPPEGPADWQDWPVCPQCGRRRSTRCPGCETRGVDFPLAEFVPSADERAPIRLVADGRSADDAFDDRTHDAASDDDVLLVCQVCDEIFTPTFYRRCAGCGRDFGRGFEPAAARTAAQDDELNWRAVVLLAVLAGLALSIAGVLAFAFSRR